VGKRKRGGDDMEALEATLEEGTRLPGFVSAGVIQPERPAGAADGAADGTAGEEVGDAAALAAANPEDIDLDEGDEEEDGGEARAADEAVEIEQKQIPDAVFGGLGGGAAGQMGALDRFKKRRTMDGDA
jgi:pre-mRNA-splicing factor SYF1